MTDIRNVLLSTKKIIYQIFGFEEILFDGTFKKKKSFSRYYCILVVMLFILADIGHVVETNFRYNPKYSVTHQVTSLAYMIVLTLSVVLPIISESFININEKIQVHCKFIEIHEMLSLKPFIESEFFVRTIANCSAFVVMNTVQMICSIIYWHNSWYGMYFSVRTSVITMIILEILTEINTCIHYISLLNETLLSNYSQKIIEHDTQIDFGITTLYPINKKVQLFQINRNSEIDCIKIYDMISDIIKIISLRLTYTVNKTNNILIFWRK